jgi:type IVB pilus formation R64 PilN family outer membrane protein
MKASMKFLSPLILAAMLAALTGCASDMRVRTTTGIDHAETTADTVIAARKPMTKKEIEAAQEVDRPYLFTKTVPVSRDLTLPQALHKGATSAVIFPETWMSLTTASQRIMAAANVVVRIEPDVYLDKSALEPKYFSGKSMAPQAVLLAGQTGNQPAVPNIEPIDTNSTSPVSSASKSGVGAGRAESVYGFDLPHMEAPMSQILDIIATKLGIHWKYEERDNTIRFYRLATRSWETRFSTAENSFSTMMEGSTSTSTNTAAVTAKPVSSPIKTEGKSNVELLSMKDAIDMILTKSGQVYANPATGTITVKDTEEVLDAADQLIQSELKRSNRTVKIWFQTIQVTRNNSLEQGVDLAVAINKALKNFPAMSLNTTSPATLTGTNAGSLSLGLFSGSANGTTALVNALSQIGDVHTTTNMPLTTRNRRAVFYNVRNDFTYVSNTTAAAATTGGTGGTPGITTSQEEVGMKLVVMPILTSKDQGELTVAYDETILNGVVPFTSAGQTVQLVNKTGAGSVSQSVPIVNGQTVLLTGFDRVSDQYDRRSLGENIPWQVSGSMDGKHTRSVTLVLATVEISDNEQP